MNAKLLRKATRHRDGVRTWTVPGAPNAVKLVPASKSQWGVPAVFWPALDNDGNWIMRGVRLDWHRGIAKAELRKLIKEARKAARVERLAA